MRTLRILLTQITYTAIHKGQYSKPIGSLLLEVRSDPDGPTLVILPPADERRIIDSLNATVFIKHRELTCKLQIFNHFLLKNGPIPASFCFYFRYFLDTISTIQIEKSIDGVLGIRTQGRRMVGADKTAELWRPPLNHTLDMLIEMFSAPRLG